MAVLGCYGQRTKGGSEVWMGVFEAASRKDRETGRGGRRQDTQYFQPARGKQQRAPPKINTLQLLPCHSAAASNLPRICKLASEAA